MSDFHLLKFHGDGLEDSVVNESFCLTLALMVGLRPVAATIHVVDGRSCLRVERYDMVADERGLPKQLHQEDFCKALGFLPAMACERLGGPSLAQCFGLLRAATRPSRPQVLRFLDYVIFNALIGNDAAHAGSFSLLYFGSDAVLAPLHDALSTAVYATSTPEMAMAIGGEYLFDEVHARHWKQFAQEAGLEGMLVRNRVLELAHSLPSAGRKLQANGRHGFAGEEVVERIIALVEQRCSLSIAHWAESNTEG